MTDPGDADFPGFWRLGDGFAAGAIAFLKDLWKEAVA